MKSKILRIRKRFDKNWQIVQTMGPLMDAIMSLRPTDSLEIRDHCEHKNTYVQDGVRSCRDCGDTIEVTSYRD